MFFFFLLLFFFNDTATTEIYTLSLHDALPISADGSLFAAGHNGSTPSAIFECLGQGLCDDVTTRVSRVDPEQLTAQEIIRYPSNEFLILGTVAIDVGDEIWVGGIAGSNRIARFPAEE